MELDLFFFLDFIGFVIVLVLKRTIFNQETKKNSEISISNSFIFLDISGFDPINYAISIYINLSQYSTN